MTDKQKKEIGAQILAIREKKGIKRQELSELCGYSVPHICKVELGNFGTIEIYNCIGEFLGFEVEESLKLKIKRK